MKKIILMFCLLLVGLSAEAQKKKKNFKVVWCSGCHASGIAG
jgi:hypothetical protein